MTQQPQPLADRIETAARTIRLRLGPNAISMAQRGEPIGLSGGEASDLAAAAMAVVQPELDQRDAEIAGLRTELEQAQPELCADCGHLKSAHYDATGDDDVSGCNASGAKVRGCNCWYFIPAAVSGA